MRLGWSRQAEADMDRIWHFLAERNLDRADRVEAAIRTRVEQLAAFPLMGRVRVRDGSREFLLADLQYRIGYVVRDDTVLVTAVRSTREDRRP